MHAAQALIFERSGKASKRHAGVQREFARLVKDDPHFDEESSGDPAATTLERAGACETVSHRARPSAF
jgi:hypothetical protein